MLEGSSSVELAPTEVIDVNCRLLSIPYSAHTDRDGIIEMVSKLRPTNVVLVHGEVTGMTVLQHQLQHQLFVPTFSPANHTELMLPLGRRILVEVDKDAIVSKYGKKSVASSSEVDSSLSESNEGSQSSSIDLQTLRSQIEAQLDEDRRVSRKRSAAENEEKSGNDNASESEERPNGSLLESSKFTGYIAPGSQIRFVGPGNVRLLAPQTSNNSDN